MGTQFYCDVRLHVGGRFEIVSRKSTYVGGVLVLLTGIHSTELSYLRIVNEAKKIVGQDLSIFIWYRKRGLSLVSGRTIVLGDRDMPDVLMSRDNDNRIDLYVTTRVMPCATFNYSSPSKYRTKLVNDFVEKCASSSKSTPRQKPTPSSPLRKSPRFSSHTYMDAADVQEVVPLDIPPLNVIPFISPSKSRSKLPVRRNLDTNLEVSATVGEKSCGVGEKSGAAGEKSAVGGGSGVGASDVGGSGIGVEAADVGGFGKVADKGKGRKKSVGKGSAKKKSADKGKGKGKLKVVGKNKQQQRTIVRETEGSEGDSEDQILVSEGDSEFSDSDFEVLQEDLDLVAEDLFQGSEDRRKKDKGKEKEVFLEELEEEFNDSDDDFRSVQGSDDEGCGGVVFNPATDFLKKVKLEVGLQFTSLEVLRQALRAHAIENRYDYYYLHNARAQLTVYCRHKCKCPWDSVRSKIRCVCKQFLCPFRVYARPSHDKQFMVISTMNLTHKCSFQGVTRKLSSEYLAEKYLEEWRENPGWELSKFMRNVYRTMGVRITYSQAWLSRARAKLLINGDGAEEYGRVWDYANALIKYNPGSTAIVVVENIPNQPPQFQRMYVCLKACKVGFLAGCRPLVGVDGCHLKGPYPGMCLSAVSMDANNNIYPVAWAVVEVENYQSWSWFLQLLMEDLEKVEGEGLTIMSDRQKGLLEAFNNITPKAEIRFCARHIWANFKLQWPGTLMKESFWAAARATSRAEFEREMEGIKLMNKDAYAYLTAIPAKHWSRHAFPNTSKHNMLLNNICESFNAAMKEARDKPIISLMEWIRRYVMKRHYEKRTGGAGLEDRVMPFVTKYLKWVDNETRFCFLVPACGDEFEVDHRGKQKAVNLTDRTCTCKNWELTGLPCVHAVVCIRDQRHEVLDYVDQAYTKETYLKAYQHPIKAMPGFEDWDKVGIRAPTPPPFRKMPGRPKLRKRRREAGEGPSGQSKKSRQVRACGNCGLNGHNMKTCKNPPKPQQKANVPAKRGMSKSAWSAKVREGVARRQAKKLADAAVVANLSGPTVQESQASVNWEAPAN